MSLAFALPLAWITEHLMEIEPIAGLANLGISKHVLAMFFASTMLIVVFGVFGKRISGDPVPRGVFVNFLESILLFLRDDVVRPFLGEDGDRFLPMVWSFFFFILACNLTGLLPLPFKVSVVAADGSVTSTWFGMVTATGQAWVTGALAACAFMWWVGNGIKAQGPIGFVRHLVPSGVPLVLLPLIAFLEVLGLFIKPIALMIRLWANMTGGHALFYAIVGLVFMFGYAIAPISILGGMAIYCLEIFVAFLQAFVFTFLMVVFLDGSLHPH
ncbi:MAG: F0F1 ATP synthase subunit A [Planctomycetes bacterium]|nr:F0F1 ATP synthase subunit A [Planctomycetota bacterium]